MKNIRQIIFASMLAFIGMYFLNFSDLLAQNAETLTGSSNETGNRLYVVVQRSEMCEMMSDNYNRWNTEVVDYYSNRPSIVFMSYDITDDRTIENTKGTVEQYGLLLLLNANQQPGRVFLIDPNHQQVINMVDIHQSSDELRNYINEAAPVNEKAETGF